MPAHLGMALRQIFAENLRAARLQAELSQEELADAAGVDRTYVSALERSRYAVTVDVIERLAVALQVTPDSLLREQTQPKSPV